jgi:exodeoxyribonuclease V alpha subunit
MKCRFNRLIYPRSIDETQNGSYMIAVFIPRETIMDSMGNRISSFTVVGYNLPTSDRITVNLSGHWKRDPKYGLQFEMDSYDEVIEPGKSGIVAYLSSGLIRGIGPGLAERIYNTFGADTMAVLDNAPERISEVPGISAKKGQQISKEYRKARGGRKIIMLLAPLGISARQALQLQMKLGKDAENLLKHHPYTVFESGYITFQTAEALAQSFGIPKDSPERIDAGLLFTLQTEEGKGHLCMHNEVFINNAVRILDTPGLDRNAVARRAYEMLKSGRLVLYHDYTYRPIMAQAEAETAACITQMLSQDKLPYMGDLDDEIDQLQVEMGIVFAAEQRHAIKVALTSPICIISGGPGTGKTSIQRAILSIYSKVFPNKKIVCCAPTGRAARRMEQSTGFPASTVHKAINLNVGEIRELKLPDFLEADLVLSDEISMLDMVVTWHLFHALPPGCRLILVGDADQLPSVGPGAVLSELLRCGKIPMVILDKVFRQSEGSLIAENAKRIRHGEPRLLFDHDFLFYDSSDAQQSAAWLEQLYVQEVAQYGVDNVAMLTPYRKKTDTGVQALNARLRERVNPAAPGKAELAIGKRFFRQGDKVMQTQNRDEVSNGDIGYITKIERCEGSFLIEVDFGDGRIVPYEDMETLNRLELAYATTIHKSQGAEYESVLINIQQFHSRMLKRPLFYTGITRAKRRLLVIGEWDAIVRAIHTLDTEQRKTMLAARIVELNGM